MSKSQIIHIIWFSLSKIISASVNVNTEDTLIIALIHHVPDILDTSRNIALGKQQIMSKVIKMSIHFNDYWFFV